MKRESTTVKIWLTKDSELVNATLFEGLASNNISDHDEKWIPSLKKANQDALRKGLPIVAEDAHWNWERKIAYTKGQMAFRNYVIEYNHYTVGLLMLQLVGKRSRLVSNKDIVYIDYISVCPEARKEIKDPPDFKAIGKTLFMIAIQVSFDEGMEGRIGLHSLPKAIPWYAKVLGMKDLGIDPKYENLHYFELEAATALSLCNQMKERNND